MRNKNRRHKRETPDCDALIAHLRSKGWKVTTYDKPKANSFTLDDYDSFVEIVEECVNPQGTVWFNCAKQIDGEADVAFEWDAWEKLSLEANPEDESSIKEFWLTVKPIVMSVKDGVYSYFAISFEDSYIRFGNEPEFEDVTFVSDNVAEFFEMIIEGTLPPLAQRIFE